MLSNFIWKENDADENPSTVSVAMEEAERGERKVCFYLLNFSEKKGEQGVEESGKALMQMVQWFHRDFLMKLDKGSRGKHIRLNVGKNLKSVADNVFGENGNYGYILLVDNHVYTHLQGGIRLFLINKRYSKGIITELTTDICGTIQRGAGLFMACEGMVAYKRMRDICDILLLGKYKNEKNMENRLRLLAELPAIEELPTDQCVIPHNEEQYRKIAGLQGGFYLIYE